jgi:serine/threonine-protein kinase
LLSAVAAGAHRVTAGQHAICAGGPERAATVWSGDRRAAIERAFTAAGGQDGARAFAGVAATIDSYVARWVGMYRETCEATHVRGEQSADVLDLRMGCLGERLGSVRALGDVFMSADAAVVDNAVGAASALPALDRCADVEMLRAVIRPPDNPALRAKVTGVRDQIAKVKALGDSGQCQQAASLGTQVVADAKATGYLPVLAEASFAVGRLGETCTDVAKAVEYLQDAAVAAEASRHDQVFVESSTTMAGLYADRLHDLQRAREAVRHGGAVLSRLQGHPELEGWFSAAESVLAVNEGRYDDALAAARRSLDLRQQVFGADHYEVAAALNNVAVDLHALHRDAEAEPFITRAADIAVRLFGPDNSRVAVALLNRGEILTGLGQFAAARGAIDRALWIWRSQKATDSLVGYGLLDLGRLQEAEGDARAAVKTIEESIPLLGQDDGLTAAEARFALARVLWTSSAGSRTRAREMAHAAREIAATRFGSTRLVQEIDTWVLAHRLA